MRKKAYMNDMNQIRYLMRVCQIGKATRTVGLRLVCFEKMRCCIC